MKKRLMSTLLMGAFFLASTSMFVSCKDYDDDINANTKAIQNVETSLKEQIATLNSALQQEKTAATAAHSQYEDAIAKAQAAADAANKSLSDALVAAATHATTSYVDDAVKNGTADKATVSQLNDAIGNLQTTLNAAIDGKASTADLNSAIAAVNDKIAALQGDIAAATNAQSTLSATLTSAIQAVDQKVDTKASSEAVNALSTVLQNVQQSMQTKADVQEAIAAATANLATNASVAEKIQAAADAAKSDVNLAKAELQAYADKAATAAATEAAATAKADAIAEAIKTAQNLEEKLTTSINQLQKDGAAADAQLQKNLNDSVAVLVAKIGGINTNLSSLIDINKNAIAKNMAAIENINLQIDALNRFTGLLEDKNVVSLKDSLRLTYAELQAAKKTLGDELIRIETKVDENALAYAAALLTQKNELTARIDSLRDNYATEEELEGAVAATTLLIAAVDNRIDELIDGDIATLQKKVKAIEDNIGEASIAAMLKDIADINKTITVSGLGKIENLDEILEDLQGQIDDLDGALSEYKEANDKRVKAIEDAGFISETAIDGKIATAVSGINTELGKYVQKAEIDQFLTGTKVVAALQTAGFALSSDLDAYVKTETLDNYLKKTGQESFDAIVALGFISQTDAETLANNAREDAKTAANEDLQTAIDAYDAQLAAALKSLFAQITGTAGQDENGDDEETTVELPTAAKEAIEALKLKFEENQGVSPAVAQEIDVLWLSLDGKLTSLVFYPEAYYGGIESIEITALKIDSLFSLKDVNLKGTPDELFTIIKQTSREFDLFPNGFAKYHINPVNASLDSLTLAFIDHTATTRSADVPYLTPVNEKASENYRDANDILWVEFENNPEVYNAIDKASGVPGMGHYYYKKGEDEGYAHGIYGDGEPGKGIVTSLTASNKDVYVASDYALLVPVTINGLILANSEVKGYNEYETSDLDAGYMENITDYNCNAAKKFHLHRKAIERIQDDKDVSNMNKIRYDVEEFDLKDLVETHFVNSSLSSNLDEKMDDDLFERLGLDYRFYPVQYTTDDVTGKENTHLTSETKFITLTEADPETGEYFNGKGYFNKVEEDPENNGKVVYDEDGKPARANKGSVGRRPVVRVELYSKENPKRVYAVGYLKIEITEDEAEDAQIIEPITISSNLLFATCDAELWKDQDDDDDDGYGDVPSEMDLEDLTKNYSDFVILRWDQVQDKILNFVKPNGLTPKVWNNYEWDGQQYYRNDDGTFSLQNERAYDPQDYPYYRFGSLIKVKDASKPGNYTDLLAWGFDDCDYKSLYYDLQMRYSDINEVIDENGKVLVPITRYFRLTDDTNAANPTLYIGLTIPAGTIYFPAGTIGKVIGGYWKEAASNEAGDVDIILNTPILRAGANTAQENDTVKNGWFEKELIKRFFNNRILIDFNYGDLAGEDLALAKSRFETEFKDWYEANGASFYFRMPNKNDAKEGVVYEGGNEWLVNGLSGIKYTLQVTDLIPFELKKITAVGDNVTYEDWTSFLNLGNSVSVTKINGIELKDFSDNPDDPDLVKIVEALYRIKATDEEYSNGTTYADSLADGKEAVIEAIQKIQNGAVGLRYKNDGATLANMAYVYGIRVMTLDNMEDTETPSLIELQTKLIESIGGTNMDAYDIKTLADAEENDLVKGITQDMLNYKKHNSEGNVSRPYDKQLSAFITLYAVDEALFTQPDCGDFGEDPHESGPSSLANCYIMPGFLQGTAAHQCNYCTSTEIEGFIKVSDDDCLRPFVKNKDFAVRFYEPVDIEGTGNASLEDADLSNNQWTINYVDVLNLYNWNDYRPGAKFTNFIKYYKIEVNLPEGMIASSTVDTDALTTKAPNAMPTVSYTGKYSFLEYDEEEKVYTDEDGEEVNIKEPNDVYDAAQAYIADHVGDFAVAPPTPTGEPAAVAEMLLEDVKTVTLPKAYTGEALYDDGTLDESVTPEKTTFKSLIAGVDHKATGTDDAKIYWSSFPNTKGHYDADEAIYLIALPANATDDQTLAYNYYLSDKAKVTGDITAYLDGTTLYDYADYQKYVAYEQYKAEKAAWDAANEGYVDYAKLLDAQKYVEQYNAVKYKVVNDGVEYTDADGDDQAPAAGDRVEGYFNAYAAWSADKQLYDDDVAANTEEVEEEDAIEALFKGCYTDLGNKGGSASRPALSDPAEIEKLPTLYDVNPEDFTFKILSSTPINDNTAKQNKAKTQAFDGGFVAEYQNTGSSTNEEFHIYVPLNVTYYYLNEAPAAPKRVYARLTVTATTGNNQTEPTAAGARRK